MKKAFSLLGLFLSLYIPFMAGNAGAVETISAGGFHVAALQYNGRVWVWGENGSAQLGGAMVSASSIPIEVQMPGLQSGVDLSAGGYHTLVLLENGQVAAFGRNDEGELGNGATGTGPSLMSGLTGVTKVAAGGYHSVMLKNDGTVWCAGANWNGQLGDGTTTDRATPVQVSGLSNVVAISAGLITSYAVKNDGTLWAWGGNTDYQLGDGSGADQVHPVRVGTLTNVTAVSGGFYHASALLSTGRVMSWGFGFRGQLGDGNFYFGSAAEPVEAYGITDAVKISAGSSHTLVLRQNGALVSFGSNWTGQLGIGQAWASSIIPLPQNSVLTSGVVAIAAGNDTTFALKNDGSVSSFGYNEFGQMGDASWQGHPYPAQAVGQSSGGGSASGGAFHSVVRRSDGTVGWMGYYDLQGLYIGGLNPDEETHQLKVFPGLTGATQVSSGDQHTLILKSDKTVWAFGVGWYGQLGNNEYNSYMQPVQAVSLSGAIAVSAGGSTSVVVKDDYTLWAWGNNDFGQLGDGTTNSRAVPMAVTGLTNVIGAAAGDTHIVAVKGDGTVWVIGDNSRQQLISGGPATITTPTQVPSLAGVIAVAAGNGYSLALKSDATVVAWGVNDYGELGLGDTTLRSAPVVIPGLAGVAEIVAADYHGMARFTSGTVAAWGMNNMGQIGDGTFETRLSPVTVASLSGVTSIGGAFLHSLAVKSDGSVWTWGNNGNAQLGQNVAAEHQSLIRLTEDLTDTDEDGLPDAWELAQFGNLSQNGLGDYDYDGLTNAQEYEAKTSASNPDTDGDGFKDGYEVANGLNPRANDAGGDLDGDGVLNWKDARPQNPSIGELNVIITSPANGSILN